MNVAADDDVDDHFAKALGSKWAELKAQRINTPPPLAHSPSQPPKYSSAPPPQYSVAVSNSTSSPPATSSPSLRDS